MDHTLDIESLTIRNINRLQISLDLCIILLEENFMKCVYCGSEESKVIEFLQKEDAHLDEIAKILQFDTKKLLVLLTTMEIRGLIKKLPGNYYGKKD